MAAFDTMLLVAGFLLPQQLRRGRMNLPPYLFERTITMDVMNPTYEEVERALDLDLAKLTLTMVWARQSGYIVEPKLVETFGLDSHT
jgi:hypothetical protein